VLVLVLVLVIEKNSRFCCHAGRNRTVAERSGPLLGADGQQIEHEHEHDAPNFGFLAKTMDEAELLSGGCYDGAALQQPVAG